MKALIAAAAVGAVGFTTAMAQGPVYSVNVVGFVNVDLVAGYNFLANPLQGTNNSINTILPVAPDFSSVIQWDNAGQTYTSPTTFLGVGTGWDTDVNLAPGEGFLMLVDQPTKITFVGEVLQGSLTNQIGGNYNLKGSQVPQAGKLVSDLQFNPRDFDTVLFWDPVGQTFGNPITYLGGGAWDPDEPTVGIAQSFFLLRDPGLATQDAWWTRTFNVQ